MIRRATIAALFALTLLPAAAWAQYAYTNRDINLRAGPNREFPLVTWVPGGVQVYVNGCIEGWTWCDVTVGDQRGWVYADFLSYDYYGQPVTIVSGGAVLGLPLITFSIGPYWDSWYRYQPWYGNRYYWYNRPPTWWYRPPPPPPPRPIVRPPPPRPPNWHGPGPRPPEYRPQPRPPDYRPPSQPRPPTTQPMPQPGPPTTQPRPPGGGRPPQGAPEYSRPSSPPQGNAPRPQPQSKPDVRPAPHQQGMVLKPDVGRGGQPYSQQ